jgi:hypothetical protein
VKGLCAAIDAGEVAPTELEMLALAIVVEQETGPLAFDLLCQLAQDRALRNKITGTPCPQCGLYRASLSKVKGREGSLWCTGCGHRWELPKEPV